MGAELYLQYRYRRTRTYTKKKLFISKQTLIFQQSRLGIYYVDVYVILSTHLPLAIRIYTQFIFTKAIHSLYLLNPNHKKVFPHKPTGNRIRIRQLRRRLQSNKTVSRYLHIIIIELKMN